jgi:transcriptional regulator with XRE-family HTH domain
MRFDKNKRFLEIMQEKRLTFAKLAEMLKNEYSAKTLYQYADGRRMPNKSDKKKIADALGCLVRDIF